MNGNPIGDQGCRQLISTLATTVNDPYPFLRRSSGYLTPSESRKLNADNSSRPPATDESKTTTSRIKELDLGDTNITDSGIAEVSYLLESNSTLHTLNLNGNRKITTAGWARLGQALAKNNSLRNLSLDFCPLGDNGLEALVKGLRSNKCLRSLELESTGLTERGGLILRDFLKENGMIYQVIANPGNSISVGTLEEIRKLTEA